MKEFLSSQAAIIITLISGALGYLIRYFFERKSKRQYRKFELFEDLKIKAITTFVENYHITLDYITNDLIKEDFSIADVSKKFTQSYYVAISFCTKSERIVFGKIFSNINSVARSSTVLHNIINKKTDKKFSDWSADSQKMMQTLSETRKEMDKLIDQNLSYYR